MAVLWCPSDESECITLLYTTCEDVETKSFKSSPSSLCHESFVFMTAPFFFYFTLRKQEDLVQNVRRRLEEALTADMLAHIEDTAADAAASKVEEKVEQVDKEEL